MTESKKEKSTTNKGPKNPGYIPGTYKKVTETYNPREHYPEPSKNVKTIKHSNTSHGGKRKSKRKTRRSSRKNTRRR
jgi:hypothetical protein